MADVILKSVGKVYPGGVRAVQGVDLHVRHGEFIVLVGPSGCGKSTTLRMVAGLEEISEGSILIGGRVVNDIAPSDRDIAMVFQNYALYPHMTVGRNMAFGLERRRRHGSLLRSLLSPAYAAGRRDEAQRIRARVDEAAGLLGLQPLLHRMPRELSGGQRQRVAVGRAIVRDPAVFLFDEPLSNLDAKLRGEMRTELRILHRRLGATMMYVTHDQEEAMGLADRIVVMKDGLVQQVGAPTELYDRPVNRFVAGFIGTPTMNIVEGAVERDGSGIALRWAGGRITLPRGTTLTTARAAIGVRPDTLTPVADGPFRGTVQSIEFLGDRADVLVDSSGVRLNARVPTDLARSLREGAPIALGMPAVAHVFDGDGFRAV
ncbi:MAG: ATP-binding cassette domain-containing protein [Planctomycetes bacterium]|nr:ATP-binding cassette domain-containing protein [Planctomycetota bacterium]